MLEGAKILSVIDIEIWDNLACTGPCKEDVYCFRQNFEIISINCNFAIENIAQLKIAAFVVVTGFIL